MLCAAAGGFTLIEMRCKVMREPGVIGRRDRHPGKPPERMVVFSQGGQ